MANKLVSANGDIINKDPVKQYTAEQLLEMHVNHINKVLPPNYVATVVLRHTVGNHHCIYGNDDLQKVIEVLDGADVMERTAPVLVQ